MAITWSTYSLNLENASIVKGAVSQSILPFLNKMNLQYLLIYLQTNIKRLRERNPPRFERGTVTLYGLL